MPIDEATPPTDTKPFDSKHFRRARVGLACAGILVLVILWTLWSSIASHRLQSRFRAIRARHEPFLPGDFKTAPNPLEENGAEFLSEAALAMPAGIPSPSNLNTAYAPSGPFYLPPPYGSAWRSAAENAITASADALSAAHKAALCAHADWRMNITLPLSTESLCRIFQVAPVTNLLGDAAMLAHIHGNDAEAVERLQDIWGVARIVAQGPLVMCYLSAEGIDALGDRQLEIITPDLLISGDVAANQEGGGGVPVSRSLVVELIHEHLDEGRLRRDRTRAFWMHRMAICDAYRAAGERATVLRPMLDLEEVRELDDMDVAMRALSQSSWPSALAVLAEWQGKKAVAVISLGQLLIGAHTAGLQNQATPPRYSHIVSSQFEQPVELVREELGQLAERRVVAIALAIRLYRADRGTWPTDLKALVPAYLPKVPADPFAAGDQPIGYVILQSKAAGDVPRPTLFFTDPLAGTSSQTPPPTQPCFGWMYSHRTQWRDLSRWPVPSGSMRALGPAKILPSRPSTE